MSQEAWGGYDSNPYYNPEKCGLEIVAELEFSDGNYEFDTRVVWRDVKSGKLYTARDSGCSCPTPFDGYGKLDDLDELTDIGPLVREIDDERQSTYSYCPPPNETQRFIEVVFRAWQYSESSRGPY